MKVSPFVKSAKRLAEVGLVSAVAAVSGAIHGQYLWMAWLWWRVASLDGLPAGAGGS
jgi:hypothetical protein